MNKADFLRWFNRGFWKAFSRKAFPIQIPNTRTDKAALLELVYDDIASARYAPGIPEAELVINKGYGVARTVPVFSIRDYCVYYFCIKELEDVLCGNRTPNTFGGWTLGGQLRVRENDEIENDLTAYGRYSFNPQAWTHAFGEFNALLFAQLDPGHYAHVLQLDLSNFYDCVRLDILEREGLLMLRQAQKDFLGQVLGVARNAHPASEIVRQRPPKAAVQTRDALITYSPMMSRFRHRSRLPPGLEADAVASSGHNQYEPPVCRLLTPNVRARGR